MQTYTSGCDFPMWGQYLLGSYMIVMLCLFGNFYVQSYIKKKNMKQQLEASKKTDSTNGVASVNKMNGSHSVKNGQTSADNGALKNGIKHRI